jgi:heme exporter protein D
MNWNSPAEFFAMGGYGFYVWGSYAVTLALMLAEPLLARRRHGRALAVAADAANDGSHA